MTLSLTNYRNQVDHDPNLLPRTGKYKSVADIFLSAAAEAFRKPGRMSVSDCAKKYVIIKRPGARSGSWDESQSPYMVEPQNLLSSRELQAIIFVGPSQSGKTEGLILNWLAYSVMQEPMDMIIFNPTQQNARDFAVRRVDRLNANSKYIKARLIRSRAYDNKGSKQYDSGMILNLSWPTTSEMAGKPVPHIALTDYDRMDDSVGDEGSPFDLAFMRTTTFKSFAMTVAESSPSRPLEDMRWVPSTPHEAPPCKGILSLYNRGDRRRLYWPCPYCGEYFEGKFSHLKYESTLENVWDAADTVRMICPSCDEEIWPDQRQHMLEWSIWLKDGQSVDLQTGKIVGKPPRTKIASFWMRGVAAGFTTWQNLVVKYMNANREFERTGDENALQQFYNNDLGEPYIPKAQQLERLPEILMERAEPFEERHIHSGIRFLIATVDVQVRSYVVQVHGIGPGTPYDITVVDRWTIRRSKRQDPELDGFAMVRPGTYQEDWELLIEDVMQRTYPLEGDPTRRMGIRMTACDSGGEDGVTTQAYAFYRSLRTRGMAARFHLVKGNPTPGAPRTYIDFPDSRQKSKFSAARGDVPVLFLQSNMLKDALNHRLDSLEPGKGMIRFPSWLPVWFYKELCVEHRDEKGRWTGTRGIRNEAWDLLYYCIGVCASSLIRAEQINWINPPIWANEWDVNPLIIEAKPEEEKPLPLTKPQRKSIDFSELGKELA